MIILCNEFINITDNDYLFFKKKKGCVIERLQPLYYKKRFVRFYLKFFYIDILLFCFYYKKHVNKACCISCK